MTQDNTQLEEAIQLIKADNKAAARDLMLGIIDENPHNDIAWWWLSQTYFTKNQQAIVLEKGLKNIPDSILLKRSFEMIKPDSDLVPEESAPIPRPTFSPALPPNLRYNFPAVPVAAQSTEANNQPAQRKPNPGINQWQPYPTNITPPADETPKAAPIDLNAIRQEAKSQSPHTPMQQIPLAASDAPQPAKPQKTPRKRRVEYWASIALIGLVAVIFLLQMTYLLSKWFNEKPEQYTIAETRVDLQATQSAAFSVQQQTAEAMPTSQPLDANTIIEVPPALSFSNASAEQLAPPIAVASQATTEGKSVESSSTVTEINLSKASQPLLTTGELPFINNNLYFLAPYENVDQIWLANFTTRDIETTTLSATAITDYAVSARHGWIAYITNNQLFILNPATNEQHLIFSGNLRVKPDVENYALLHQVSKPIWSADGLKITFSMNGINIIDLEKGTLRKLVSNVLPPTGQTSPFKQYQPLQWVTSRNLLVAVKTSGSSMVAIYKSDARSIITNGLENCCDYSLNNEGYSIYLTSGDSTQCTLKNQSNTGIWAVNVESGFTKSLEPKDDDGLATCYAHPKQSDADRLFLFSGEAESELPASMTLYATDSFGVAVMREVSPEKYTVGEALWADDGSLVLFEDLDSGMITALSTTGEDSFSLDIQAKNMQWQPAEVYHRLVVPIDLDFNLRPDDFDKDPITTPAPDGQSRMPDDKITSTTSETQTETGVKPAETSIFTQPIDESGFSSLINQKYFNEFKGSVYPEYPSNVTLLNYKAISEKLNISIVRKDDVLMVWLGEYLTPKPFNGEKDPAILRDVIVIPEQYENAGFSIGSCSINGSATPLTFSIGTWSESLYLDNVLQAFRFGPDNTRFTNIDTDGLTCVLDVMVIKENGIFSIWGQ